MGWTEKPSTRKSHGSRSFLCFLVSILRYAPFSDTPRRMVEFKSQSLCECGWKSAMLIPFGMIKLRQQVESTTLMNSTTMICIPDRPANVEQSVPHSLGQAPHWQIVHCTHLLLSGVGQPAIKIEHKKTEQQLDDFG